MNNLTRDNYDYWLRIVRGSCSARNDGRCSDQVLRSVAFMCWDAWNGKRPAAAWQALDEFHGRAYERPA